jgi:murein DD-endopeptidase MepM/ murein hydrolase activator NlpD
MKGNAVLACLKKLHPNSLPDWPQVIRHKGVWIFGLLLLITSIFYITTGGKPVILLANDEPLAVVANEGQVNEALTKAKSELEKQYGISISGFTTKLSYDAEKAKREDKALSDQQLVTLLKEKLAWTVKSWSITVNDKPALYLASEEGAQAALELLKKNYLPEGSNVTVEKIVFNEEVKIVAAEALLWELKTPEKAAEIMMQGLAKASQYTVKNGDSLWTIARDNNMTVAQLKEANPEMKSDFLKIGQKLNLVKAEPLVTVVSIVTTTVEEKIPYPTQYESDSSLWRGQQSVKQEGAYGSREVTYRITKANGVETSRETLAEKVLLQPISRVVVRGTKMMVASRGDGGSGILGWPTRDRITSGYGKRGREFHTGIDIDGVTGDPVYAAEDGVVLEAGWDGHYGKSIVVDHGRGLTTRYAHLSSIDVSIGQRVSRGSIIGKVGSTGRSTGSHLHFEVRINGEHQNPLRYLER